MGKPPALRLAIRTLADAPVVRVTRAAGGGFTVATEMGSPVELRPGRYALVDLDDMEMTTKRIAAGESALMLASAVRRETKRTSLKRR